VMVVIMSGRCDLFVLELWWLLCPLQKVGNVSGVVVVAFGSPNTTPLGARINELERKMLDEKLVLVDDDGKPQKPKVDDRLQKSVMIVGAREVHVSSSSTSHNRFITNFPAKFLFL
ncbi:hypothetical protein Tco_1356352, partial [Tanacetum coccineum]